MAHNGSYLSTEMTKRNVFIGLIDLIGEAAKAVVGRFLLLDAPPIAARHSVRCGTRGYIAIQLCANANRIEPCG